MEYIPFPNKKYQIIYADPPWDVKAGPEYNSNGKSRDLIYPTMSVNEIKKMDVKSIIEKNSKIFLWTINKYLKESFDVLDSWGFKYSTMLVWVKNPNGIGLGGTFSLTTEYLLFGFNGKIGAARRWDTTWFNQKRGRHSRKPDFFRDIIDETFPHDKKIELFAREKIEGWDFWGDEVVDFRNKIIERI